MIEAVVLCLLMIQLPGPALSISCAEFENGDKYSIYEAMLLEHDMNTLMLEEHFYPTNYHSSIVVDINYLFVHTSDENITSVQNEKPWEEFSEYHFRWMVSPVNLFIRPGLLSSFSLKTYQTRNVSMFVILSLPYNCTPELLTRVLSASSLVCDHPPPHLDHLNTLTANLESYVLHRKSIIQNGLQLDKEKRYSAYFFGDSPSDYCIINQEKDYSNQRFYMNVGALFMLLAIMLATPMILTSVYDNLRKRMKGNVVYFVWSVVFVSAIAELLMVYLDLTTLFSNLKFYPHSKNDPGYHDIFMYFIMFIIALIVLIVGDSVAMVIALRHIRSKGGKKVRIPALFKVLSIIYKCLHSRNRCCTKQTTSIGNQDSDTTERDTHENPATERTALLVNQEHDENDAINLLANQDHDKNDAIVRTACLGNQNDDENDAVLNKSDCFRLIVSCTFFALFLQFCSLHSFYIVLAALSTPVTTLSITSFYIAAYFCLVTFIAVVLKATDNEDYYKKLKCSNVCKIVVVSISAILFIICAVFFVLYFYKYTIMVQGDRNSGGIFGSVGSILPSLIVAFGGFCGTRIIKCIKSNDDNPPPVNAA